MTATDRGRTASAPLLLAFTATIFLSALLLFSVQPLFTKLVLPRLGGSPSVWSVAVAFFQTVLLAAYAYAHLLVSRLTPRAGALLHLAVMGLACLALPIALPALAAAPPTGHEIAWLVGVFALAVGPPFFAVSGTAPLLQAWFARSGHARAAQPYFLYAASNAGSLLALLAYPVLIEPFLTVGEQSRAWTIGYAGLIALIAACALLALRRPTDAPRPREDSPKTARTAWSARLAWIVLSAVPSGLLVALTAHISTDIAAAPFLWVGPLALYLVTFIITFQNRPAIPHRWALAAQPFLVAPILALPLFEAPLPWPAALLLHLTAFFVSALVCHGELVRRRPPAARLTEFYLWMSFGGALGGVFASLIAPLLFPFVLEYPLLAAAALLARPGALAARRTLAREAILSLLLALALVGGGILLQALLAPGAARPYRLVVLAAVAALAILARARPARLAALAAACVAVNVGLGLAFEQAETRRGFFGVLRVVDTPDGRFRQLFHGTTLHGGQRLREDDGSPSPAPEPVFYYDRAGPFAEVFEAAHAKAGAAPIEVGIVGLGAGGLACYRRPQDSFTFFEIDPLVVEVARDRFTNLARCAPAARHVLGDARLTLAAEPDARFDLLVIDAFSSDSIPVHLLTVEAIELMMRKLRPGGLLVLHVSNGAMELSSVVAAAAQRLGLVAYRSDENVPPAETARTQRQPVTLIALARDKAHLGELYEDGDNSWQFVAPAAGVQPWTDDYSAIAGAIWRQTMGVEAVDRPEE